MKYLRAALKVLARLNGNTSDAQLLEREFRVPQRRTHECSEYRNVSYGLHF
jgi:hypothetical protein